MCYVDGYFGICHIQALLDKTQLHPNEVRDIVVGTVLAPGSQRAIECRMAAFYAGFPGCFDFPKIFIGLAYLIFPFNISV